MKWKIPVVSTILAFFLVFSMIVVFPSSSLGATASVNFTLVVDRTPPKDTGNGVYVNYNAFAINPNVSDPNLLTNSNGEPIIFYKVLYGSMDDGWPSCSDEWPTSVSELSNWNKLDFTPTITPKECYEQTGKSDCKPKVLNYPVNDYSVNNNIWPQPVEFAQNQNDPYVTVCLVALDKTLNLSNAKMWEVHFTDPQSCTYDVAVEAWNPVDDYNDEVGGQITLCGPECANEHTHCDFNPDGSHEERCFFKNNAWRAFRDDVGGSTSSHGATALYVLGFRLNKSTQGYSSAVTRCEKFQNDKTVVEQNEQLPTEIPNVVAVNGRLATEDEIDSSIPLSQYGLYLSSKYTENFSGSDVIRLEPKDTYFKWGDSHWWYDTLNPPVLLLSKTYSIRSGVGIAPYRGVWVEGQRNEKPYCNPPGDYKASLDHVHFRFYLSNVTDVPSLVDGYNVPIKCGGIIRIVVWGDDDEDAMGGKYRYDGPGVFWRNWYNMQQCEKLCASTSANDIASLSCS